MNRFPILLLAACAALTGLAAGDVTPPPGPLAAVDGFHKRDYRHPKGAIEAACIGWGEKSAKNPLGDRTELLPANPAQPFLCDAGDLATATLTLPIPWERAVGGDIFDTRGAITVELLDGADQVIGTLSTRGQVAILPRLARKIRGRSLTQVPSGNKNAGGHFVVYGRPRLQVHQASWSGDSLQTIEQDATGQPYRTPHWWDVSRNGHARERGEHRFPVAFVRNTSPSITAEFIRFTNEPESPPPRRIRGTGPDGIAFPEREAPYSPLSGRFVYPVTQATGRLPNTIRFYNPFIVTWETFDDAEGGWIPAGSTENRMYVLLNAPIATTVKRETVYELSCRNADGEAAETGTIAKVWSEFTDRDVRRKPLDGYNAGDGALMTYWSSWACRVAGTVGLLETSDGQCGAWVNLFLDSLKIQGVTRPLWKSELRSPFDAFLVHNWEFRDPGTSGNASFPFIYDNPTNASNDGFAPGPKNEVFDRAGVAGQGNHNPLPQFGNHFHAIIDGINYDPSYGVTYANVALFDQRALAGFKTPVDRGTRTSYASKNFPGSQIFEIPRGY